MTKYRAKRSGKYASGAEAKRAAELKLMERSGAITELREQVVYVLAPSVVIQGRKRPPMRYVADFVYWQLSEKKHDYPNGKWVVEDVKGMITPAYRLKRHLMMSVHGIAILET